MSIRKWMLSVALAALVCFVAASGRYRTLGTWPGGGMYCVAWPRLAVFVSVNHRDLFFSVEVCFRAFSSPR